jgi:predicted phosphodiesterase
MRLAIISDIHSNLQALTACLTTIDNSSVDAIYCLGDMVGYGANPNECLDLLRQRVTRCVLGNHDRAALEPSHAAYFTKPGRIAAEWTNKALTDENRAYLSTLPYRFADEICTFVHASPRSPQDWEYVATLEVARHQFPLFRTHVCFIGHTHVPAVCAEDLRTFEYKPDLRYIINVGSVGQPRDGNPELSFAIFDTEKKKYDNVRTPYDTKGAAEAILEAGLPKSLAARLAQGT